MHMTDGSVYQSYCHQGLERWVEYAFRYGLAAVLSLQSIVFRSRYSSNGYLLEYRLIHFLGTGTILLEHLMGAIDEMHFSRLGKKLSNMPIF